jgi:PIN domain nuclease of toxin-antitoxin system
MQLLLDTQIFILLESQTASIKPDVLMHLQDRSNDLWASVASIWEIAIKQAKGILHFNGSALSVASERGYKLLPITGQHAEAAAALPLLHRDPFDRILIAQARLQNLTLVTNDALIRRYSVTVL